MGQIESILFVVSEPLSLGQLAKAVGKNETEVREALTLIVARYNVSESGIHILENGNDVQMATNPVYRAVAESFVKQEMARELTKAQLETLTVVAYRGPITRPELEHIRGVNCAIILRTLLMRGLIEEEEDRARLVPTYRLSLEALRQLGITTPAELSGYNELHAHAYIEDTLRESG